MQESNRMTRRFWITLSTGLAACGEKAAMPPDLFPQTVKGVWNRIELRDLPVDESPDPVPRNSVEQIRAACVWPWRGAAWRIRP